jgi:putative transposase
MKMTHHTMEPIIPFFAYPQQMPGRFTLPTLLKAEHAAAQNQSRAGPLPRCEAATELICLAWRNIGTRWKMPPVFWKLALNQFTTRYADRFEILSM